MIPDEQKRLNDRMAKMRAAKAAKLAAGVSLKKPGNGFPPEMAAQLAYDHAIRQPSRSQVVGGVIQVQVDADPDTGNVTLVVKGPPAKMRALVRFAIEQSVPFLNDDAS